MCTLMMYSYTGFVYKVFFCCLRTNALYYIKPSKEPAMFLREP